MADEHTDKDSISENLYEVDSSDPRSELIDRSGMSPEDLAQIDRLMRAMSDLRQAEQVLSEASQRYMRLSAQDMRALHYLIVAKHRGQIVTPKMISNHCGISPASTSKLLNRLEFVGHITREMHPGDRRAFSIEITPETAASAMQTVGTAQSRRCGVAAKFTPEQREVIIDFLKMTAEELSLKNSHWVDDVEE